MKINTLIAWGAAALASAASAASDETGQLTLTVFGYSETNAVLEVGLFNTQEGWDTETSIQDIRVVADGASVEVVFENLEPGDYGIMLFHDANNDGELNTNFMGIPQEDYAFSNNARGRFGPASWENAHFTIVAGENTHQIEID